MELTLTLHSIRVPTVQLPLVGVVGGETVVAGTTLAQALADLLNQAARLATHIPAFGALQAIPHWAGQPLAAVTGSTVHIQWVTDAPWISPVLAALGGMAVGTLAFLLTDVSPEIAAAIAVLAAIAMPLLVAAFRLVSFAVQHPAQAATDLVIPVALVGAAVLTGLWILDNL